MEIRKTPPSGNERIDLTRSNRDAIRELNPNPPVQPKEPAVKEQPADPKRIKNARADFHADHVEKRVRDARDRFEAARPDETAVDAKRIKNARADFHADHVAKRVREARDRYEAPQGSDQLTVSKAAQELSGAGDAADRARRVAELKAQHDSGRLDVNGLVAETAYRMLSQD